MAGFSVIEQRQMNAMKSENMAGTSEIEAECVTAPEAKIAAGANSRVMMMPETPKLALDIQSQIGRQLQAAYDEVLHEPVPARFLKLLRDLDRKKGGA